MAKGHKRALIIVKNSEIFYVEEKTSTLVKLINQPYLEDLETIDTEVLNKSIGVWKEKNKDYVLKVLIIFSDEVLFEKTFKNEDEHIEEKIEQYLDKVPFDRPISRHYERKNETDFVVISRELFETVVDCFERQGFEVVNTVPEQLIKSSIKFDDFDLEATKKILQKFDSFKNPTLSLNNKSVLRIKKIYQGPAKNKTTLMILASMLIVLILTFLFILMMQTANNRKATVDENILNNLIETPIPFNETNPVKENLAFEIAYSPSASESATLLKNNLEAVNFKNITLKLIYTPVSNPTITFPKNLDEDVQNEIQSLVETFNQSLLIKHDEQIENMVSISL